MHIPTKRKNSGESDQNMAKEIPFVTTKNILEEKFTIDS